MVGSAAFRLLEIASVLLGLVFSPAVCPAGGPDEYAAPVSEAVAVEPSPAGAGGCPGAGLLEQARSSNARAASKERMARGETFSSCIGAARDSAMLERPDEALRYYRAAIRHAAVDEELRVARFGIARMLAWLEEHASAEQAYRELLSGPLSAGDRAVASAGLMRSLNFQDKPRLAYAVSGAEHSLSPAERIELGRAALWAGWPEKADGILRADISAEPGSRMSRELNSLRSDVSAELADPLHLHGAYISDNDDLRIARSELGAGKRLTGSTISVLVQHQGFDQHERQVSMNSVQARYSSRIDDDVWIFVQAGPAEYDHWRTTLWSGRAIYRPNDRTDCEAAVNRSVVETMDGLERHVSQADIGLSASYRPAGRVSLAGSINRQSFSDENRRSAGSGQITLLVLRQAGISARMKARYFANSSQEAIGYFNPARFNEEQLLVIFDRRITADWRLHATAGPGRQRISPGERTTTSQAELSAQARLSRAVFVSIDYGFSNSAAASSSGYRRRYSGLTVSHSW